MHCAEIMVVMVVPQEILQENAERSALGWTFSSWRPSHVRVCWGLPSTVPPMFELAGLPSSAAPPSPWRCSCCQPMEEWFGGALYIIQRSREGEPAAAQPYRVSLQSMPGQSPNPLPCPCYWMNPLPLPLLLDEPSPPAPGGWGNPATG